MSIPKKLNIKTGDTVVVISGKDKGKTGKVMSASPKEGKVMVEGVNIITRHTRARSANEAGGRIERPANIYASKVMLYCDSCKKGVRISKKEVDGKRVRVCAKCGKAFDK
ncbi:MAG: 50S ribosomal protein L24 [Clostridia bacterium]|nr:50S ribosomal protein L24 [Clostridia bacterium]MBR3195882.1 50S ribosomal protein L24 [Clostridia bacterium]